MSDSPFKKKLKAAKKKEIKAASDYKKIQASCKHDGVKTWKSKYGGYFCEECETFLPRKIKKED
jgi:hypothetical protein